MSGPVAKEIRIGFEMPCGVWSRYSNPWTTHCGRPSPTRETLTAYGGEGRLVPNTVGSAVVWVFGFRISDFGFAPHAIGSAGAPISPSSFSKALPSTFRPLAGTLPGRLRP